MHLAPRSGVHGISDSNLPATFGYLAKELGKRRIAFIAAREYVAADSLGPDLKREFGGVYVANEQLDQRSGQKLLDEGRADAVAYGKLFIANPDLPVRFAKGRSAEPAQSGHLLLPRGRGLYRLSGARRGDGRRVISEIQT